MTPCVTISVVTAECTAPFLITHTCVRTQGEKLTLRDAIVNGDLKSVKKLLFERKANANYVPKASDSTPLWLSTLFPSRSTIINTFSTGCFRRQLSAALGTYGARGARGNCRGAPRSKSQRERDSASMLMFIRLVAIAKSTTTGPGPGPGTSSSLHMHILCETCRLQLRIVPPFWLCSAFQDGTGATTALHVALKAGNAQMIKLLLRNGADTFHIGKVILASSANSNRSVYRK